MQTSIHKHTVHTHTHGHTHKHTYAYTHRCTRHTQYTVLLYVLITIGTVLLYVLITIGTVLLYVLITIGVAADLSHIETPAKVFTL